MKGKYDGKVLFWLHVYVSFIYVAKTLFVSYSAFVDREPHKGVRAAVATIRQEYQWATAIPVFASRLR